MQIQLEIPSVRPGLKMKIFKSDLPIDVALRLVEEGGGKTVIAKIRISSWGWLAFYHDTEGNCHGLLSQSGESFQFI